MDGTYRQVIVWLPGWLGGLSHAVEFTKIWREIGEVRGKKEILDSVHRNSGD